MALTLRNDAKAQIINILREQGYPTYATLVDFFDIFLTDDPEVIGYMIPGKAKIVLNKDLNIDQVSTIVRHEILHEYFTHGPRQERFDKEHPELNPHLAPHDVANIAADFDISNKGYTDADKATIRAIRLGDKKETLRGLVTEDGHPDWVDLSFEEMYQKLLEEDAQDRQQIQNLLNQMSKMSKKDIEDMMDDAQDISDQMSGGASDDNKGGQKSTRSDGNSDDDSDENAGNPSDGNSEDKAKEISDKAKQAKKAASDLANKADETEQNSQRSSNVFDTPREQRDKVDVAARAQKIRDFLDNLEKQANIQEENVAAIRKERAAKSARDIDRYQGSGLNQFKLNLNRFIEDQVGEVEADSHARIHPSYEDSEFLVPGKIIREEKNVPLVNVYHDDSASFDSVAKTAAAFKAIETLNKYVRDGDIELEVYYFADKVGDKRGEVGSGTRGTPILDHIEKTRPTNVIVITDGDINDCSRVVKVPGAVWMLFYDSRSDNLMQHLKGKRQNKYYDIIY